MPRKVSVYTTSGFGRGGCSADENRERASAYVESAGQHGADLVCLPETFVTRCGQAGAEPVPGPTFEMLRRPARAHGVWVVAGYCVRSEDGTVENCAVVIDRNGELAARYAKVHPTIAECVDRGITPGRGQVVVETDFGRMGLAICYDIGWPEHWAQLSRLGAELVVWPSAYDGGFPLRTYAWNHSYWVVSSVLSDHARIIDATGTVITSTSRWHHVAAASIDLDREVFHIDNQEDALLRLQLELGERVAVTALSEENIFTLESNDGAWPVSRIKREYGLESFRDYHARAERVQDERRKRQPGGQVGAADPRA